jgi:hypothetical protein
VLIYQASTKSRRVVVVSLGGEFDVVVGCVFECLEILLNGIKARESLSINFRNVFML